MNYALSPERFEAERLKLTTAALRRLRAERITAWVFLWLNVWFAVAHGVARPPMWGLQALSHVLFVATIGLWIAAIRRRQREIERAGELDEMLQRHMAEVVKGLGELRGMQ